MKIRTLLCVILTAALGVPGPAWTQQVSGPKSSLVQGPGSLKIVVVEGEGAINSIKSRTATQPVVEVRDENDKPVAGAAVVFQLPPAGPGGAFHGWLHSQEVKSDAQGRAIASGLTPNDEEGRFSIKVTATEGSRTGTAVITETNSSKGTAQIATGRSHTKLWVILGIVAAAAIGGGVAASRSGGGTAAAVVTNPVVISPGPITVGGPR